MKFLIQTYNKKVKHDFSFTLIQSIDYHNWRKPKSISYKLTDNKLFPGYIPIGSVEFVTNYLQTYYNKTPKPVNIPQELLLNKFTNRFIFNGDENLLTVKNRDIFVKSNDKIKSFTEIVKQHDTVEKGNYQISDIIKNIDSEWRGFVYKQQLVGLQNYTGDFTVFPDIRFFKDIIKDYENQPIAYTIDVAIDTKYNYGDYNDDHYLIEIHDFFSCGLYGFSDYKILPYMFSSWFKEYINKQE